MLSAIVVGELVNQMALRTNPNLITSPIGSIVILCTNLVIMFAFAHLIFLLAARARGVITIELYVVVFLAMWTLPNILKSYYGLWQSGWWVSEVYLFGGLLAGPPLLAILYVRALHDIEESHNKASMYADILMHDITNFNQMIMTSFELLASEDITYEERNALAESGCDVISLAEQLISNVRLLSETDMLKEIQPFPIDLVSIVANALSIFNKRVRTGDLTVEFEPSVPKAMVFGHDLIINIFLNILYGILEYHIEGITVVIQIDSIEQDGVEYWRAAVKTPFRDQIAKRDFSSGTLSVLTARTITESLHGTFNIREIKSEIGSIERIFTIQLPSVKS